MTISKIHPAQAEITRRLANKGLSKDEKRFAATPVEKLYSEMSTAGLAAALLLPAMKAPAKGTLAADAAKAVAKALAKPAAKPAAKAKPARKPAPAKVAPVETFIGHDGIVRTKAQAHAAAWKLRNDEYHVGNKISWDVAYACIGLDYADGRLAARGEG